MNKRGFTLIELLAVVVILAIIALITVPAVSRYILGTRDEAYTVAEKSMVSAARNMLTECEGAMYGDENLSYCAGYPLPDQGNSMIIPLEELITYGYIDPIEDPGKTGEQCYSDRSYVKVTNTSNNNVNIKLEYNAKLYCPSKEYEDDDVTENVDNNFVVLVSATHDGRNYEYGTWVTGSVNVKLTTTYTEATVTKYQYKVNDSEWRDISANGDFNVSTSINGRYQFRGVASNGKTSANENDYKLIRVDNTKPNGGILLTGDRIVEGSDAFVSNVTARCGSVSDEHSGIKTCGVSFTDGGPYRKSVTITEEVINRQVYLQVVDNVGHTNTDNKSVTIDRTDPTLDSITAIKEDNSAYTPNTWTNQTVKIKGNARDNLGVYKIIYTPNGESSVELDPSTYYEINTTKNTTITVQAKDNAGHLSNTLTIVVKVDKTNPNVTVTGNDINWNTSMTLSIVARDNESGLATLPYSFDNGSTWVSTSSKPYTNNENVTIKVKDLAGNIASKLVNITMIDRTAPTCEVEKTLQDSTAGVSLTVKCTDGESGCNDETHTGVKANTTYTVRDQVGNTGSCSVEISSRTDIRGTYTAWVGSAYVASYEGAKQCKTYTCNTNSTLEGSTCYANPYSSNRTQTIAYAGNCLYSTTACNTFCKNNNYVFGDCYYDEPNYSYFCICQNQYFCQSGWDGPNANGRCTRGATTAYKNVSCTSDCSESNYYYREELFSNTCAPNYACSYGYLWNNNCYTDGNQCNANTCSYGGCSCNTYYS